MAQEVPAAPTPPANTIAEPSQPLPPSAPSPQSAPTPPSDPSPPATPTTSEAPKPTPTATEPIATANPGLINSIPTPTPTLTNVASDQTNATTSLSGQVAGNKTGETTIKTGDVTNSAAAVASGNSNVFGSGGQGGGDNIQAANNGNGSSSTNTGSASVTSTRSTTQTNNALSSSALKLNTTTGENSASQNVGDSFIESGGANTTGTVVTAVNSNTAAVSISEFNVADNRLGDLVLNFPANCISGCAGNTTQATNSGNWANSDNSASATQMQSNNTLQTNDVVIGSNLALSSNSGGNQADKNTDGSSTVKTGSANTSGNVLTFANNNIAGKVLYGIVNIFGNLVGDIILPQERVNSCKTCGQNITASDLGNGANSTNTASATQTTDDATFQKNNADITNNLTLAANSGDNNASANTGGGAVIKTGTADIKSQTLNIANSNVSEGNVWLVLINNAGQWVGKILGTADGSNMAGSAGTQFSVGQNGDVTAVNSGNGSGSQNTSNVSQTTNNSTTQKSNARVVNNLNLSANSGGNQANQNTGGDSFIQTGDAKVIANLVNFVNNNIAGNGKLIVTVVNIFGSWVGDFITPGHEKTTANNTGSQDSVNTSTQGASETLEGSTSQNPSAETTTANNSFTLADSSAASETPPEAGVTNPISQSATLAAGTKLRIDNAANSPINNLANKVVTGKRKISFNLAWLLLLIPVVPAFVLIKKKLAK